MPKWRLETSFPFRRSVFDVQKKNIVLLCAITFLQGMVFYAAVATLYRQAAGLDIFEYLSCSC